MPRKTNPELSWNAKQIRKNMTPEERVLWYQYLRNDIDWFVSKRLQNRQLTPPPQCAHWGTSPCQGRFWRRPDCSNSQFSLLNF